MLTPDQVTALAPDASSFKAGRDLAVARKWQTLGKDSRALWGLALGSGKNPYQTCVSLDDIAFKCSCPSRKFPCKHALGLLFLGAENASALTEERPPDWVTEWLDARTKREQKVSEMEAAPKKAKDEDAARKRREKRGDRIDGGIDQLEQFLTDTIRGGIGQSEVAAPGHWEALARRLVDAQAPGLAGMVRNLSFLPHSEPGWETQLLHELGSLHLLIAAYRKRESLDPDLRAEVAQRVGWPVEKEEVLARKGIADRWFVATRQITESDRLLTSASWLFALDSGHWALVLNFAALPARPVEPWPLGSVVETELIPYPGVAPDRALPRTDSAPARLPESLPEAPDSIRTLLRRTADTLGRNPWRSRHPFYLAAQPARHAGRPVLVDTTGEALPWKPGTGEEDMLASICAGRAIPLAGEWNGRHLSVLAASNSGSWFSLQAPPP